MATVFTAGLTAFAAALPEFTHTEAIEAAERAIQRSRKMQLAELKLGLGTLTAIASSAPFIGLVGTCFGILYAFRRTGMEKHQWIARVHSDIAMALATAAMGLLVAVLAMWCRNYLRDRTEVFRSEMSNATLGVVMYLNAHRQWRNQLEHSAAGAMDSVSVLAEVTAAWEVPYDRQRLLLLAIWLYWLYIALGSGC